MIGTLGVWEMLALLVLALVVFGPRRLPEIGRSLGKAVSAFRKASFDFRDTLEREVATEKRVDTPDVTTSREGAPRLPPPYDAGQASNQPADGSTEQTADSAEEASPVDSQVSSERPEQA